MDNETKEMLQLILAGQEELKQDVGEVKQRLKTVETEVTEVKDEIKTLKTEVREVKRTVKKTAYQVDILYDWVDGIDLKVKSNTDLLSSLPLAK